MEEKYFSFHVGKSPLLKNLKMLSQVNELEPDSISIGTRIQWSGQSTNGKVFFFSFFFYSSSNISLIFISFSFYLSEYWFIGFNRKVLEKLLFLLDLPARIFLKLSFSISSILFPFALFFNFHFLLQTLLRIW